MIPVYKFWLHGLYQLHGPCCPLSRKALNLITQIYVFENLRIENDHRRSHVRNFSRIIVKHGKDIDSIRISGESIMGVLSH